MSEILPTDNALGVLSLEKKPTSTIALLESMVQDTYIISGMTPEECVQKYVKKDFDFEQLMDIFSFFCQDFHEDIIEGVGNQAVEFCTKIIFELGPKVRQNKAKRCNTTVRFRFHNSRIANGMKLNVKCVLVSTLRREHENMVQNDELSLTFEQAELLALVTFDKVVTDLYLKDSTVFLTPLCAAVFSKSSITEMASKLRIPDLEVIQILNQSTTLYGGQYLPKSDMACAIVAHICFTQRVAKDVREWIISKVIKEYSAKNKVFNTEWFEIFASYALGGIPSGLVSDNLINTFNNVQNSTISMRFGTKS